MRIPGLLAVLLLVSAIAGPAAAEEAAAPPGPSLIPIPVLFYTPETRLAFGASGLYLFGGSRERPNRVGAVLIYTLEDQVLSLVSGALYPGGGRYEVEGVLSFSRFPGFFYGIGNDTSLDDEESWTPRESRIGVSGVRAFASGPRLGAQFTASRTTVGDVTQGGLLDGGRPPGIDGGWTVGAGLRAGWDSRDRPDATRRGAFAQLDIVRHARFLGSDFTYTAVRLDGRGFVPLGRRVVLAARAVGRWSGDETPFYALPGLGGGELLRGVYDGRYRDRSLAAGQVEVRAGISGALGVVVFAESGTVAPRPRDLSLSALRVTGGAGLRVSLSAERNIALRFDYGAGRDSGGFYIALGEAF